MTEEHESENTSTIKLVGDDGSTHECEIVEYFDFEDKEYVILLKNETGESQEEEPTLVIMRLIKSSDSISFQTIEDDEEFENVMAFLQSTVDEHEDFKVN